MKNLFIFLFLITSTIQVLISPTIFNNIVKSRKLTTKVPFLEHLKNEIMEVRNSLKLDLELDSESQFTEDLPEYKIIYKQPGSEIGDCKIEGKIGQLEDETLFMRISFDNSLETNRVQIINIDLNDIQQEGKENPHNLRENYIEPFLKHCGEILNNKELELKEIKKIIDELEIENYSVTTNDGDYDGQPILYIRMENPEKNDERFNFTIALLIDENNVLQFQTSFFDAEIGVAVVTKTSLKTQLQELITKTVRHFKSMQQFAGNETEQKSQHEIECGEIIDAHQNVRTINQYTFTLQKIDETKGNFYFKDENDTFPQDENLQLKYKCFRIDESNEDSFLFLQVSFEQGIDPLTQPFLFKSFYDLKPVAESFWEEIFDLSLKLYAPSTGGSFIAFEDEIIKKETKEKKETKVKDRILEDRIEPKNINFDMNTILNSNRNKNSNFQSKKISFKKFLEKKKINIV